MMYNVICDGDYMMIIVHLMTMLLSWLSKRNGIDNLSQTSTPFA
ncbi:hypothetical protein AT1219_70160 [Vibrio alginolyticus]